MDEQWDKIIALDLEPVRKKFAFKKNWWWLLTRSPMNVERQYRQFLYLIATNPGKTVVPWSHDLDDFWHEHILHTEKYAQDCQAIMGGFIHHNPHLPEGSPAHTLAFSQTRDMYVLAFGKEARKRRGEDDAGVGFGSDGPSVFCDGGAAGHHGGGHHGGGHHGCGGHGGGHGCGGGGGH